MFCSINDLREKEVVCVKSGRRFGCVCDVEIDLDDGKLVSMIIFGRSRFFGLLGREEDVIIKWDDIEIIGDDIILVKFEHPHRRHEHHRKQKNIFNKFFG